MITDKKIDNFTDYRRTRMITDFSVGNVKNYQF